MHERIQVSMNASHMHKWLDAFSFKLAKAVVVSVKNAAVRDVNYWRLGKHCFKTFVGEHQAELLDFVAAKFHEELGVFKLLVRKVASCFVVLLLTSFVHWPMSIPPQDILIGCFRDKSAVPYSDKPTTRPRFKKTVQFKRYFQSWIAVERVSKAQFFLILV